MILLGMDRVWCRLGEICGGVRMGWLGRSGEGMMEVMSMKEILLIS